MVTIVFYLKSLLNSSSGKMVKQDFPTLKILVAGGPGRGKENFISRLLEYYPSSAEVHRKNVTTYLVHKPDKEVKIELHYFRDLNSIDRSPYTEMDAVFFCYSASDTESFQGLAEWIVSMANEVEEEAMDSSLSLTMKAVNSVLVADLSNVDGQQDVADHLSRKAQKLKESFGIQRFIKSSFEDEESAACAFQIIFRDVISPILKKKSFDESPKESPEDCFQIHLNETFPCGLPEYYLDSFADQGFQSYGNENIEDIFRYNLICRKTEKNGS